MVSKISALLTTCVLCLSLVSEVSAQKTGRYKDPNKTYERALELLDKEKYGGAQQMFESIIEQISSTENELRVNAEFYSAYCALQLFNRDAQLRLTTFVRMHPESDLRQEAYFALGNYAYRKKKYDEVLDWFLKVNQSVLDKKETIEFKFKLGYSYLRLDETKKALGFFYEIKNQRSDYYLASNYYFAHLSYLNGNYTSALESFQRLDGQKGFKDLIPYYLTQIFFLQKKYQELVDYTTPLLEEVNPEKQAETIRLLGEAHYKLGNYEKAIMYVEQYVNSALKISAEDAYLVGYSYYKQKDYGKAVDYLKSALSDGGPIAQKAYYYIGHSYLALEKPVYASNSFRKASKMHYDKRLREDALFSYAKLAYELSYNPYHEAIEAFNEYIVKYPDSDRIDEAREFLLSVYLTTRSYDKALTALEKIRNKDFRTKGIYQTIAFNQGVEKYLSNAYDEAFESFAKVLDYPVDDRLVSDAWFWQAEIKYRQSRFGDAIGLYRKFLKSNGVYQSKFRKSANYSLGYAFYKSAKYSQAREYFRKYVNGKMDDPKKNGDAYLRIADCFFVEKDYPNAIKNYQKAINANQVDVDYGLLNSAMCKGYMGQNNKKVNDLELLLTKFQDSKYTVEATYELADAYFKIGENTKALETYGFIAKYFPESPFVKKSLLSIGLIHYRNGDFLTALASFKQIAEQYTTYEDAKEAIARAEDIYVELGRIEEYNTWVGSLTYYNVTNTGLDSTNYRSAENLFSKGEYGRAIEAFEKYLEKFNPALFKTNAHFYLAECYLKSQTLDKALFNYNQVINQKVNKFSEASLFAASTINYNKKDYKSALSNYKQLEKVADFKTNVLEAQIGQMRCYFMLQDFDQTAQYAETVLFNEKTPDEIKFEALVTKAKSIYALGRNEEAQRLFWKISEETDSETGAEAKYFAAEIYFKAKEFGKAEEEIFAGVGRKPTYDFWLAKNYILLGQVYWGINEREQALATLQSIVDYHEGVELKAVAKEVLEKYQAVIDAENAAIEQQQKENVPEVIFDSYDKDQERLFDTESEAEPKEKENKTDSISNPGK
ncbi:MAG: TolA-binding protein [Sphingobacteriales bacterium]|jgi:TolA-binding protein